jgi:hypothetical protein
MTSFDATMTQLPGSARLLAALGPADDAPLAASAAVAQAARTKTIKTTDNEPSPPQASSGRQTGRSFRRHATAEKPEKFPLAALRWHGRFELDARTLTLAESQLALSALVAMGEGNPDASARPRTSTPRTRQGVTLAMSSTTIAARSIRWGSRSSPT